MTAGVERSKTTTVRKIQKQSRSGATRPFNVPPSREALNTLSKKKQATAPSLPRKSKKHSVFAIGATASVMIARAVPTEWLAVCVTMTLDNVPGNQAALNSCVKRRESN